MSDESKPFFRGHFPHRVAKKGRPGAKRKHPTRRAFEPAPLTMKIRDEIKELRAYEDAPARYSPMWIDILQDAGLRAQLRGAYLLVRKQVDKGRGISVVRDFLIRRFIWCERICNRLEMEIEFEELERKAGRGTEYYMEGLYRMYHDKCDMMTRLAKMIGMGVGGFEAPASPSVSGKQMTDLDRALDEVDDDDDGVFVPGWEE